VPEWNKAQRHVTLLGLSPNRLRPLRARRSRRACLHCSLGHRENDARTPRSPGIGSFDQRNLALARPLFGDGDDERVRRVVQLATACLVRCDHGGVTKALAGASWRWVRWRRRPRGRAAAWQLASWTEPTTGHLVRARRGRCALSWAGPRDSSSSSSACHPITPPQPSR
jgi:hypothetical protein